MAHRITTVLIACVWFGFGLGCKVLGLAPRHEAIVARILGDAFAGPLTIAIGVSEIVMAVWVLSGFRARWCAIAQIAIVGTMNVLETILVPDLLLWGHFNMLFALGFMAVVYVNEWVLRP